MSMQIQAQLYLVETQTFSDNTVNSDPYINGSGYNIVIYSPDGSVVCNNVENLSYTERWQALNIVLNDIINQGYRLLPMTTDTDDPSFDDKIYFLSNPWTTVGLTEINSSELNLRISPNPTKEYINVKVDFNSQPSELVLISEQGYIYFKKDISNILSGQEFTIDVSNVPAGKYLVTIKDNTQYLTPKKLIVF